MNEEYFEKLRQSSRVSYIIEEERSKKMKD
jgi:hypothetical protein